MNPVKLLIHEHVIIHKMIELLSFLNLNPQKIKFEFLDKITDFLKIYVDRCHHQKEEKVLFQKLKNKNLKTEDLSLMNELIEEHKLGRKLVSDLIEAKNSKDMHKIKDSLLKITTLYLIHIEKENTRFFYPAFNYFTEKEKDIILQEFFDIDKNIIHEKYLQVIEELKASIK